MLLLWMECSVCPFGLIHHLKLMDDLFIDVSGVSQVPQDYCIAVYSSLLGLLIFAYIFRCSYVRCINVCKCYILLLDWPLSRYIMTFLVSHAFCYGLLCPITLLGGRMLCTGPICQTVSGPQIQVAGISCSREQKEDKRNEAFSRTFFLQ